MIDGAPAQPMEARVHRGERHGRIERFLSQRLLDDPRRNPFDLRDEQVPIGGSPGLEQLGKAGELLGRDGPCLLGRLKIRNIAVLRIAKDGVTATWVSALRRVCARAKQVQRPVPNRRADVCMDLCVGGARDSVIPYDGEELLEGSGDDVVAICLAESPDRSKGAESLNSDPAGELFPAGHVARATTLQQAAKRARCHRAVTGLSPSVPLHVPGRGKSAFLPVSPKTV